jgi:hypothetical protein
MAYFGNNPVSASYLTDYFSGNNTTVAFTLSRAPVSASSVIITISGVKQAASTYGVSGTTLTFSAAPPSGTNNIEVLHLGVQPDTVVQPSYRTITEFTATAGQTTFSPASYTAGYIDVYRNGVKLGTADFTATNGTSVVLANACAAGDYVRFEGFLITSFNNAIANTNGAVGDSLIASVSASKLTGSRTLPNSVVPAGTVLQVVSNHFNNYQSSTSTSYVAITGSLTSITPISASSKILVSYSFNGLTTAINSATAYQQSYQIIDSGSNVIKSIFNGFIVGANQSYGMSSLSGSFLHSPSTTSAYTYQLQMKGDASSNGFQINNYASFNGTYSSITLTEIAQ